MQRSSLILTYSSTFAKYFYTLFFCQWTRNTWQMYCCRLELMKSFAALVYCSLQVFHTEKHAVPDWCSFCYVCLHTYHHTQKMHARYKPLMQALQQDQVQHGQEWATTSNDVWLARKQCHYHRSVHIDWVPQCSDQVHYSMKYTNYRIGPNRQHAF